MIKRLIDELVNDKITLTQALTRAKVLAFQLDNRVLTEWIKYELEGYQNSVSFRPNYRSISCDAKITISDRFGRSQTLPLNFKNWLEMQDMLMKRNIDLGIPTLETNYEALGNSQVGIVEFPSGILESLYDMLDLKNKGLTINTAGQQVKKLQLKEIIELTRQKLIDTLLQLNKEFPNFNDEFKMDEERKEKAHNIITNNIYGSNNPVNLAAGNHVEQTGFNFNTAMNFNELEKYGVEPSEIQSLKTIVEESQQNKSVLRSKVIQWIAAVSSNVASKGLTEHLPAIVDFVQNLIK